VRGPTQIEMSKDRAENMKVLANMKAFNVPRGIALGVSMLALAAMTLPVASLAVVKPVHAPKGVPRVNTAGTQHVLGGSAVLTGSVNPDGAETTYYFQYGLTTAYGLQTPAKSAGSGTVQRKIGEPVTGLQPGAVYHYRIVAFNEKNNATFPFQAGRDRAFTTKGNKLKFVIPKPSPDVYGSPYVLSGTLTGFASANHRIALQASPFPFLESFTPIGLPGVTDASGRFSFRITNLTTSTQFRLVTLDPRPVYSPQVRVPVAVHVTFKVRSSGHLGLVRLYGTVSPAVTGAHVLFQVQKAVRPGKNEVANRYITQFVTTVKHAGANSSRFSMVVKLHKSGRYRAFVKLNSGGLASGIGGRTYVLHAAPSGRKK